MFFDEVCITENNVLSANRIETKKRNKTERNFKQRVVVPKTALESNQKLVAGPVLFKIITSQKVNISTHNDSEPNCNVLIYTSLTS